MPKRLPKKITNKWFAEFVLGCTPGHFQAVLSGKRGFGYSRATQVSKLVGGDVALWLGELKEGDKRRVKVWKKYQKK